MLCRWEGNGGRSKKYWQPDAGFLASVMCGLTVRYQNELHNTYVEYVSPKLSL